MYEQQAIPAVLAAKLTPPTPRPNAVARTDLVARLESAGPRRLRAVIAPAGWGKSELLAQWLAAHRTPFAYVQLDAGDRDAARFWTHLLTSIGRAARLDVGDLLDALRSPAVPLVTEVVEPLLARLAERSLTVVVEDLHLVADAALEESLTAFVDRRPPLVGVAITTRAEPELQLARRRVRDELVEIRRDDLRLGADDACAVVTSAAGAVIGDNDVGDDVIAPLLARTEGWAAGLYLAGLSLRSAGDVHEAVGHLAGDDRNIGEFLAAEVLDELDEADREFLVGTAVLDELDGPLCDAVLGSSDAASRLPRLARTNLFLIPLDQHADHYRYHHLFQDWLLRELDRRGRDAVSAAHRRASAAYAARGDVMRAGEHALASGDATLAYALILRHRLTLLDSSQHATVARWYRRLPPPPTPDDAVEMDLLRAWAAIIDGDLDTIDRQAARARTTLTEADVAERVVMRVGEPDLLRAYGQLLRGDFAASRTALEAATSAALPPRAGPTVAWLQGVLAFWLGEPAQDALDRALELAQVAGVPYPTVLCRSYQALAASERLDLPAAERSVEAAFATVDEHRVASTYLAGPYAARAAVRQSRGHLEGAMADASTAVELAERRNDTPLASLARLLAASVHHTLGDRAAARAMVEVVARDVAPLGAAGILGDRLAAMRRQLRLQQPPSRQRFDQPVEELTDREMSLLRLLPGDLTQRELGEALHMSFNTVKSYNRQIYRKLGVSSRDDAVAAARVAGLL